MWAHTMKAFVKQSKNYLARSLLSMVAIMGTTPNYGSQYDIGANDTEIVLGNTAPMTGNMSTFYSVISTAMAYIEKINTEEGGVNNRKVVIISKNDYFEPTKTVELTRELIEKDRVLFIFLPVGTPTGLAAQDYLNRRQIPQLFATGASNNFFDPLKNPWTISISYKYSTYAKLLAKYLLSNTPDSKVAILYVNSDYGQTVLNAFKEGLGDKVHKMIVKELPISPTDTSVDFQIQVLKRTGADTFLSIVSGKLALPAAKFAFDSGWKPRTIIPHGTGLSEGKIESIGRERILNTISASLYKNPGDPLWSNDKGIIEYKAFMKKYNPKANVNDHLNVVGYFAAQLLIAILKKAGDNLTRENIMNIAKNLRYSSEDFPILMPGIDIATTPTNYELYSRIVLTQFDGHSWIPLKIDSNESAP
jgi:branched-chain amino acid transport system substrate-binding protein